MPDAEAEREQNNYTTYSAAWLPVLSDRRWIVDLSVKPDGGIGLNIGFLRRPAQRLVFVVVRLSAHVTVKSRNYLVKGPAPN
jgi:hypothetical protein